MKLLLGFIKLSLKDSNFSILGIIASSIHPPDIYLPLYSLFFSISKDELVIFKIFLGLKSFRKSNPLTFLNIT